MFLVKFVPLLFSFMGFAWVDPFGLAPIIKINLPSLCFAMTRFLVDHPMILMGFLCFLTVAFIIVLAFVAKIKRSPARKSQLVEVSAPEFQALQKANLKRFASERLKTHVLYGIEPDKWEGVAAKALGQIPMPADVRETFSSPDVPSSKWSSVGTRMDDKLMEVWFHGAMKKTEDGKVHFLTVNVSMKEDTPKQFLRVEKSEGGLVGWCKWILVGTQSEVIAQADKAAASAWQEEQQQRANLALLQIGIENQFVAIPRARLAGSRRQTARIEQLD